MFTLETTIDALKRFDIDEATLQAWEDQLGLSIPKDESGRKRYSPHHINLFKNVKKHLTLGRSLEQIKQIINLPPANDAKPHAAEPIVMPVNTSVKSTDYTSMPKKPQFQPAPHPNAGVVQLVDRLMQDKDQLQKKLVETEKLNSHLYNANNMFHRKVKELTEQVQQLKDELQENQNFKLLDDKDKLHKQLLAVEKVNQFKDQEIDAKNKQIQSLEQHLLEVMTRFKAMTDNFEPELFCGNWVEKSELVEIVYDNFGINIEPERSRLIRISEKPSRTYGNLGVILTHYEYETNSLWKRMETMMAAYQVDDTLAGELVAEYILDGVPVAKAIYRLTCQRQASQALTSA